MLSNNRKCPDPSFPCDVLQITTTFTLWVGFVFIGPESRTVVLQIGPHYIRIYGWGPAIQNKYLFGSEFRNQIDAERPQSFKIQMHDS